MDAEGLPPHNGETLRMVDASVVTETGGWWRARYGSADRSMYSRSFWIKFFLAAHGPLPASTGVAEPAVPCSARFRQLIEQHSEWPF